MRFAALLFLFAFVPDRPADEYTVKKWHLGDAEFRQFDGGPFKTMDAAKASIDADHAKVSQYRLRWQKDIDGYDCEAACFDGHDWQYFVYRRQTK